GSAGAQQAAPTQGGLQSYDVELLIFRNLSGKETQESWGIEANGTSQGLSITDEDGTIEAPAATAPTATFPALPAAKMKLTALEDTMRRSRAYQPLAHIGWTQPGFARNAAKYLSVNSLAPGAAGLQGQIALSRGRYLHLTLDLVYDSMNAAGDTPQKYVLRQTRRMRSNERHYIDSPKLGVIAVITPTT
ncbi:MAG: CsiV family protein, partial [Steroidobacter sp.]